MWPPGVDRSSLLNDSKISLVCHSLHEYYRKACGVMLVEALRYKPEEMAGSIRVKAILIFLF
jgi:hypothetical protein